MDEEEARLELAQKSYDEVLDATKHQDDKIGRFLTAIAFLFTGAIAFGIRSEIVGVRVAIVSPPLALPALFLGLFLVLAILSVLLLLVALGPNLNLPSPERESSELEGKRRSRIYFLSMDRMTPDAWWKEQWEDNPPTIEDAVRNYVYDAHNLATKTTFKSGRTNEARTAFTLALFFLALSVVLSFEAATRASAANPTTPLSSVSTAYVLPWDGLTRGLIAITTSVFAFALAYDYLRYQQTAYNFVADSRLRIRPLYILLIGVPAFSALCLVPVTSPWPQVAKWTCEGLVVFVVAALVAPLLGAPGVSPGRRRVWVLGYSGFGLVAVVLVWILFDRHIPAELLLAALISASLLELPRLSLGFRSWLRLKHDLKTYPHLAFIAPPSNQKRGQPQASPLRNPDDESLAGEDE